MLRVTSESVSVRSRVAPSSGVVAMYGVNTFLIKYPAWFKDHYPQHVRHATFYGRLISSNYTVNIDVKWFHNDAVSAWQGVY